MILENDCNITKSEKFKGVWILSVPTVYLFIMHKMEWFHLDNGILFLVILNKVNCVAEKLPAQVRLIKSKTLHLHLADGLIQSDLQCIQGYTFFVSTCVPWELNPRPLHC